MTRVRVVALMDVLWWNCKRDIYVRVHVWQSNSRFHEHVVSLLETKPEGFVGRKVLLKGVGFFPPVLQNTLLTLVFCSSLSFVLLIFSTVCGVNVFFTRAVH